MKTKYQQQKAATREKAISWQMDFSEQIYTWGELADWQEYFARLGRRFGLLREFRENGIC